MAISIPAGPLTERRKHHRKAMSLLLVAHAVNAGAKARILPPNSIRERSVMVRIEVEGGAYVHVDFDGASSQPDVFVATWNIESDSDAKFSGWMPSVNQFHQRKSTVIVEGFDRLVAVLTRNIELLVEGKGYLPQPVANAA